MWYWASHTFFFFFESRVLHDFSVLWNWLHLTCSAIPSQKSGEKWGKGASLMVLWLRLWASNTEGAGLIPGWGAKVPYASWLQHQNIKQKKIMVWIKQFLWRRKQQLAPVFLPGKSHGRKEPGGLPSMGLQRVGHDLET